MSKSKTKTGARVKPDRIKLAPANVHPDVARALREIQAERSCPMGMAIDELFYRLQRANLETENLKQRLVAVPS